MIARRGRGLAIAAAMCSAVALAAGLTAGAVIVPYVQQGPKLTPGDAFPFSGFGTAIATAVGGDTVAVGGPGDHGEVGAVWIYTRTGSTWSEQQKIVPPDVIGLGGLFGGSVALSADGDTLLVGGTRDNGSRGAAWIYTRSGATWAEAQKLPAPSAEPGSLAFGGKVALSADGSTAFVAAQNRGVWVFAHAESRWSEQQKIPTPADAVGSPSFGTSVALTESGATALVGAPNNSGEGAAWVFTRSGDVWSQQQKLVASDPSGPVMGYGVDVALSSDASTVIVGGDLDDYDRGALWTFTAATSTGTEDTTKPVITVPANITLEATGPQTTVGYVATINDDVDVSPTLSCAPASGAGFAVGATTVTCTGHDASGNEADAKSFTITVTDTAAPAIANVPDNVVTFTTALAGIKLNYALPTATDVVDGSVPVVCTPPPDSWFPVGVTTTVICTATDAHGNSSLGAFAVTVGRVFNQDDDGRSHPGVPDSTGDRPEIPSFTPPTGPRPPLPDR